MSLLSCINVSACTGIVGKVAWNEYLQPIRRVEQAVLWFFLTVYKGSQNHAMKLSFSDLAESLPSGFKPRKPKA